MSDLELVILDKFDHINWLISLSVIPLTGVHCSFQSNKAKLKSLEIQRYYSIVSTQLSSQKISITFVHFWLIKKRWVTKVIILSSLLGIVFPLMGRDCLMWMDSSNLKCVKLPFQPVKMCILTNP